jgi:hypothetical protein
VSISFFLLPLGFGGIGGTGEIAIFAFKHNILLND